MLAVSDALAVVTALILALDVTHGAVHGTRTLWGLVAVPLMVLLFKLYDLYDRDLKRISHTTVDDVPWIFHAVAGGTLLLWLYSKTSPMGKMSLEEVVIFGAAASMLSTAGRFSARLVTPRLLGAENALLVGEGRMADVLASKLAAHPEYGANVVGMLTTRVNVDTPSRLPILGSPDQLSRVAERHQATRVFVAGSELEDQQLEELLRQCRAESLKVSVLPQLSDLLGPSVVVDDVEGVMVLGVNPPWLPRSSRLLKRLLDLSIAVPLLVLCAPLWLVIATLIKLDSRGSVLFAQQRVGRQGRPFRLFKFRSMVADAEARRSALLTESEDPNWLKLERDPRITRIGHWLRRLSLDELPQLWNVVRGEMSIVGPRPLIPSENERVSPWAARGRLDLTPGITGYWQVLGRTRIPFEEMVKLDYLYVMNWSLWEDIRLILRTLPVVVAGRGVN